MSESATAAAAPPARDGAPPARFAASVLQLVSGAALAQVLALALAPVIARLYAPDTFGAAATFAAMLTILNAVVTLRYEMAILLPESDRAAAGLAWGSLLVVAVLSALLYLLIALGGPVPEGSVFAVIPHVELLPLAVLLGGITMVLIHWGIRQERFGLLSANRVVSASVAEVGRLVFGVLGHDVPGSLIVANIIGVATGILVLVGGIRRQLNLFMQTRVAEALSGLRDYVKFPLFASWATVLNALSHQVTPIVLGIFFAAHVVGHYAQANRITVTPLILMSAAITQVFSQGAARARREGTLASLTTATARNMLRLAWYPAVALFLLGPELTTWFLGAQWAEAGRYVRILSVWMLITLVSDPLSALYAILERQEIGLGLNITVLVLRVGGLVVGGLRGDPILALTLFAGTGALLNLGQVVLLVRLAGGRLLPTAGTALLCLGFTIPLLLLKLARPLAGTAPIVALFIMLAGGLCYGGLWLATDHSLRGLVHETLRGLGRRPVA
jgi:lipopolysaccharide exporter